MPDDGLRLVFGPPVGRSLRAETDRFYRYVRRVEWGAAALIVVLLAATAWLRIPSHAHAQPPDLVLQRALTAWMNGLPAIGVQADILNTNITQLLIVAGAAALWFGRPQSDFLRKNVIIGFCAFFPAFALARIGQHWGSFPSDRAAVLAIATFVAFTVNRRAGIAALCVSIYACLFRIAYFSSRPSDIAGGVLLGALIMLALFHWREALRPLFRWLSVNVRQRPAISAALATIFLCEFSDGFRYTQFFAKLVLNTHFVH